MLGVPSLPVGGAAAGLREEVGFGCCEGFWVVSRVCVCEMLAVVGCGVVAFAVDVVVVVVEKLGPGGRGKGRRRRRV